MLRWFGDTVGNYLDAVDGLLGGDIEAPPARAGRAPVVIRRTVAHVIAGGERPSAAEVEAAYAAALALLAGLWDVLSDPDGGWRPAVWLRRAVVRR